MPPEGAGCFLEEGAAGGSREGQGRPRRKAGEGTRQEGPLSGSAAAGNEGSLLEGQDGGRQQGASRRKPDGELSVIAPARSSAFCGLPLGLFRKRVLGSSSRHWIQTGPGMTWGMALCGACISSFILGVKGGFSTQPPRCREGGSERRNWRVFREGTDVAGSHTALFLIPRQGMSVENGLRGVARANKDKNNGTFPVFI